MANLVETSTWETGIYQLEEEDLVQGGSDGIDNRQAKQLGNRTLFLKQQVEAAQGDMEEHLLAVNPHPQYASKDGAVTLDEAQTLFNKIYVGVLEKSVVLAESSIDLSAGNLFSKTISSATTFTVTNVPAAGIVASFILEITNGGAYSITWFSGVKWANGAAPTLTAAGMDILGFYTRDGGATWRGIVLVKDSK